ncbi:MAG: hypothetical protein ACOC9W_04600 [Persicimonas sp.]
MRTGSGVSSIIRYNPQGGDPVRIVEFDGRLVGPIYDPSSEEFIFMASGGTDRLTGCETANGTYYRLRL